MRHHTVPRSTLRGALRLFRCSLYLLALQVAACPMTARADPVRVHLIHLTGPGAVEEGEVAVIWSEARRFLRAAGVRASLYRITRVPARRWELNTVSAQPTWLSFWRGVAGRAGWGQDGEVVHFIAPPVVSGEGEILTGIASGVCVPHRPFSLSSATASGSGTAVPLTKSALALAHEVLHLFGAGHLEGAPNLMSAGALASFPASRHVLARTRRQVRACRRCSRRGICFRRSGLFPFD